MEERLTVVQMNDSHAYFDLHPELFWEQGQGVYRRAGGYARIATLLKTIRAENPGRVLFVDGGDTFHGTYAAVQTRGESLVPILNGLAPDGMTAHWEFAYTPAGFQHLAQNLDYPVLAMNVYQKDSRERLFQPYQVIERGGLRIGLAGIASNIVDKTMPLHFSEGAVFTDGRAELPDVIEILRRQEHVDLVMLVSHLGFPQDMQLVQEIPGVDVDLSAHTHHRLHSVVRQGNTLVIQSGSHGSFITRLDLVIENGRVTDCAHELIEVGESIEPDPETAEQVRQALAPFQETLAEVVGKTRTPLDRGRSLESTMDNLLQDAMLDYTGTQLSFSNGWRYGAPIPAGPVTVNDLYNMTPMNPAVSTVELRGAEVLQILEENLEHTFSRDPFRQMGGYVKRVGGARMFLKVENPPMQRIQQLFVGKTALRPEQTYRVAFITEQGVPKKYGQNRQTLPDKMVDVLRAYLRRHGSLDVGLRDTYVLI